MKIFTGVIQGYGTDMAEYFTVDERAILQRAGKLQAEGLDTGEIMAKVAVEVGVSPGGGGVHYRAIIPIAFSSVAD